MASELPEIQIPPRTIDEVLRELDRIVDYSLEAGSRLGYFAALYRKVTRKVKEGIESGFFEDGPRMERLDVVFAGRYLAALEQLRRGERPSECWQVAFDAAGRRRLLILQQLLLGINAHINLDLGIAAAEVAPGALLPGLRTDFERINEILFALVGEVQQAIGEVSPWIAFLSMIGGKEGDELIRFSLGVARDEAWRFAGKLAPLPPAELPPKIAAKDREIARLGREIRSPGPFLRWGLLLIRMRESGDVRRIIELLAATPEPTLATVEARRLARPALAI
jgi:hypothetical protein